MGVPDVAVGVNVSLGELDAMVTKAFRGAGYSWGLAAEGGRAARKLGSYGIDPTDALLGLLARVDADSLPAFLPTGTELTGPSGVTCPICLGAVMSDRWATPASYDLDELSGAHFVSVAQPLLLAPGLIAVATSATPLRMDWADGSLTAASTGLRIEGDLPDVADVAITWIDEYPASPRASRVDLAAPVVDALGAYAHRTYAPATEQSRSSGAGEG